MARRLPRLLFAWELGNNYGHIAKVADVVRALAGRAEMFVAVRAPASFRQIAPEADVALLAAPAAPPNPPIQRGDAARSYPDALRHSGWGRRQDLIPLVESWRTLFDLVRPDVLVAQAATTAILAARGTSLPTVMFGSGFDTPPRSDPMPPFHYWRDDGDDRHLVREREVLETANATLETFGAPPLERFSELLRTDRYLLATYAQLDHYATRARFEPDHPPYLGQITVLDTGREVDWRPDARRRVLAYLRPGRIGFDAAVGALARFGPETDVLLAAPGASAELAARLRDTRVRLFDEPMRLDRLLETCDLGLSHGSAGTSGAFALSGVPQIALPGHAEQAMFARTLAEQTVCISMLGRYGTDEVARALVGALSSQAMREAAARLAEDLGSASGRDPGPAVADEIMGLAAAAAA